MNKTFAVVALSLLTLTSMAQADLKTKTFHLDEFNRVVTQGGGNVEISPAHEYTLQLSVHPDCLQLLEFSVASQVLYIEVMNSKDTECEYTIYVGMPKLNELDVHGGGNIILQDGFRPKDTLECSIHAGGYIDASKLAVDFFDASIQGGGHLTMKASAVLHGNISGGGLIEYSGDPEVKSSVSGGGTIRRK